MSGAAEWTLVIRLAPGWPSVAVAALLAAVLYALAVMRLNHGAATRDFARRYLWLEVVVGVGLGSLTFGMLTNVRVLGLLLFVWGLWGLPMIGAELVHQYRAEREAADRADLDRAPHA